MSTKLKLYLLFVAVIFIGLSISLLALNYQKGINIQNNEEENPLKSQLTQMQYYVTQENGTEPAFQNEYHDNHEPGIYVDIVSGEPLFSSIDKYDSDTGWPSFTKPIMEESIVESEDFLLGYKRIEIRSKTADSHLGHLFDDGPLPSKNRYCINSAALRFVHKDDLQAEGLDSYLEMFN